MVKFLLSFITVIIALSFSCGIASNNENSSLNNKKYTAKHARLRGLVEVKGDDVFITVNPDCKCRKSFKVIGSKKEELKKLNGLFVEVEGITKEFTPWSGEIFVKKIYILEK